MTDVAKDPIIQAALMQDDENAVLKWVDAKHRTAVAELESHRERHPKEAALASRLKAVGLLEPLLDDLDRLHYAENPDEDDNDPDWRLDRVRDEFEQDLRTARQRGISIARSDVEAVARFTYAQWKRQGVVSHWERIRTDARDVAGVELKPVIRSELDGRVIR